VTALWHYERERARDRRHGARCRLVAGETLWQRANGYGAPRILLPYRDRKKRASIVACQGSP
jgi:hypothetical protein